LCTIQFVDPVPNLQIGNNLISGPVVLAYQGTPVGAIAADGAARVVVRIAANSVGEQLEVTVLDENNQPGKQGVGWLSSVNGSERLLTVFVTAEDAGTPMAFAVYYPPSDFSRGSADYGLRNRQITVKAVSNTYSGFTESQTLTILRPPVVMVHGIWTNMVEAWKYFKPFMTDQRFFVRTANYDMPGVINSSNPQYPSDVTANNPPRTNALGFAFNASTFVLPQIKDYLVQFRSGKYNPANPSELKAAAAQVDVVAHSMGGDVTRTLEQLPEYTGTDSFGIGNVHKLITIGTPHLGSPLATELLPVATADPNLCVRNLLAKLGNFSFISADIGWGTQNGGEGDLMGNGQVIALGGTFSTSSALQFIQSGSNKVPTAMIAGQATTNLSGLGAPSQPSSCATLPTSIESGLVGAFMPDFIRTHCPNSPVAQNFTTAGWKSGNMNGLDNDGIVPVTSQLNNTTGIPGQNLFLGVVHSIGAEEMGFCGPNELGPDGNTGIQTQVINLLNESTTGPDFYSLP